ncbi:hypothetical protein [Bacillus cereus group sp. BfR-BA-00999]|uniref:hypothetical protein n=1 Tax=Bacillus cereus group TaxID=86661 RepID=UPI00027A3131|nr:hypothetical protein [Bacillus cereus group sp. BfR-BA-00999]EJR42170.1 hypothetical protein IIK_05673 [Bacillus cereus VD102]MDX5886624.1 hypothetical protein [Bacillus cereus group sp. BfR-BA-00999]
MEEVNSPRNKLEIGVSVDTDEAEVKLKRLKEAAEGCKKAFEELGEAIASVGLLLNGNQAECAPLALGEKKQLEEWINGCGPLEK